MREMFVISVLFRRECISDPSVNDLFKSRLRENSEMIQTLLNFVWNFWDHPLEVWYACGTVFSYIIYLNISGMFKLFITKKNKTFCNLLVIVMLHLINK